MNVIGIVVEYNPFHNGHIYQINKVKEKFPNSIIIVVMSTCFTQRGEISVLDKWDKTRIALNHGVDIVIELPFVFTNQSADIFAKASIRLLNELKINTLVFGSECNNIIDLKKSASIQLNNPAFDTILKSYINDGHNYPTSINKTIKDLININLSGSNDLLAISYIKEILKNAYNIDLFSIKRTNDYLDIHGDGEIISASNIRNKLLINKDISKSVPEDTFKCIKTYNENTLFSLIKASILSNKDNLNDYHLVSEGIENRIYLSALKSNNLEEMINSIKTKRYTYNSINRILINILVGFKKNDALKFNEISYIRILGLSNFGKKYLSTIKKNINLKIYSKFEKDPMMDYELKVTSIYSIIMNDKNIINKEIKGHIILK